MYSTAPAASQKKMREKKKSLDRKKDIGREREREEKIESLKYEREREQATYLLSPPIIYHHVAPQHGSP